MAEATTTIDPKLRGERTPGGKFGMAVLLGFLLAIPLFAIWLLVYDRQSQSETARASIAEGWGGPQIMAGPLLVIPYQAQTTETVDEGGKAVTKTKTIWRELTLAPEVVSLDTLIKPERRSRSIYDAVVYEATVKGQARFALPTDLPRFGVDVASLALDRAELRFGLSDARGLFGPPPRVTVEGKALVLQPGNGLPATTGAGFFTWLDARELVSAPITADFGYDFRGNGWLTLSPRAGDTTWKVTSSWPSPSFQGGFLPATRSVTPQGFTATYRVGNLALGQSLVQSNEAATVARAENAPSRAINQQAAGDYDARVDLVQPVDLYDQVSRASKYGFLFIGFTFLAFLMFDVIGGVRVSGVEYLLVGVGLILFFVLLLAFAEVVGFTVAYLIASAAIIGLITAYSASVLKSRQRAGYIAGLLIALYAVLYILLSLEAYSLLIGSVMLFAALAAVMYVTRNLDWSGRRGEGPLAI
ncbi:MAG: colicin resistance protein [Sphingomonadales bacterium]|nr:colicin resistance protein [Sphingomonadales bacterium]